MDPWGQLWHSGVVEHLTAVQLVGGLIQNWKMFWFKLDMARVFQVRHQDRFNCVELRPFQWVIRLPLLFDCMLGRLERGIILMVVVDAILTMSRENFQIVKFVAIHLRLLRLGKVFLSLNKDRQKFHLTRYCRTFKNSRVTEYLKCTACGEPGWRFYARFSTSSVKSCFFDFRYARISVSVCCRSQLFCLEWDGTPCTFLECIWTALRLGQRFPFWPLIERGCENLHQCTLRDQLHAYYFVFGCIDGRQHCEWAHHVA